MSHRADVTLVAFERRHLDATLAWSNDPELQKLLAGRSDTMFRAIHLADGRHVGNVWLADIDRRHRKAEVRVLIGDRPTMGGGAGSTAIDLMARHAFDTLGLHRVYAYVLAFNPRARRAFEKAGFVLEGTLKDDRWDGAQFVDAFLLGRVNVSER
jgi:RimJ/RimL family protein N-acetyltransferase